MTHAPQLRPELMPSPAACRRWRRWRPACSKSLPIRSQLISGVLPLHPGPADQCVGLLRGGRQFVPASSRQGTVVVAAGWRQVRSLSSSRRTAPPGGLQRQSPAAAEASFRKAKGRAISPWPPPTTVGISGSRIHLRASGQLEAAIDAHAAEPDNELIGMALIKAYAFSFELSWKTLKDLFVHAAGPEIDLAFSSPNDCPAALSALSQVHGVSCRLGMNQKKLCRKKWFHSYE